MGNRLGQLINRVCHKRTLFFPSRYLNNNEKNKKTIYRKYKIHIII